MNRKQIASELLRIANSLKGRNVIELVPIPGFGSDEYPKFRIMFRGEWWGDLFYHGKGYFAQHGLPVPSGDGRGRAVGIGLRDKSLEDAKQEVAKSNQEWEAYDLESSRTASKRVKAVNSAAEMEKSSR